ncbi:hypothetical protein F5882DRAFT_488362 [Hyaloscypha sp. PMI_1271]|nr:hypothetical protein F5882DRAFT_488362 [Hyaloscypha sp. PMI_1271]
MERPTKKQKLHEVDFGNMGPVVTFILGKSKTRVQMHKHVLSAYSPVFRAAFNNDLQEGETGIYRLEDVEPAVFGLFSRWIYRQTLVSDAGKTSSKDCSRTVQSLPRLWVFAEKFCIPQLQNDVIDLLRHCERVADSIPCNQIPWVYDNTSEESLLRCYLVEPVSRNLSSNEFKRTPQRYTKEFLLDMATFCTPSGLRKSLGSFNVAQFHVPVDVDEKEKDKTRAVSGSRPTAL